MPSLSTHQRVVSGMRVSGKLHLGHLHGVIKNWIALQHQYECFFFAADWHGLTTNYDAPDIIKANVHEMVIDWLAAGVKPEMATIFIQSQVPEHAELHLLLAMITPLSWLERIPTYKDQQQKLKEKKLATFGFLGYPLLQSADVLIYRAGFIPVGEDQLSHIELARELARRFNYLYGREFGFAQHAEAIVAKMGKKNAKLFSQLRKQYLEQGDKRAFDMVKALLKSQTVLNSQMRQVLSDFLDGRGKIILPEPKALLTKQSKVPGLDGKKMSKSYGNFIGLRESPKAVEQKIRTMPTDPARVRRSDPGDPQKCPVWYLHKVYSTTDVKAWVQQGCVSASIGCIDCKQPLINSINAELTPIRDKAIELQAKPSIIKKILAEGAEKARATARQTMQEVRAAMGLDY